MSSSAGAASWPARWRQRIWRRAPGDKGTVVLRHRRIYVLPTRRGLALIATLATMLVASMNYALSLGFALTFLIAGLVAAALLHTYRNLNGIAISAMGVGEAFAGTELSFTLSLGSPSGLRQGVVVATAGECSVSVDLAAGSTQLVQL